MLVVEGGGGGLGHQHFMYSTTYIIFLQGAGRDIAHSMLSISDSFNIRRYQISVVHPWGVLIYIFSG